MNCFTHIQARFNTDFPLLPTLGFSTAHLKGWKGVLALVFGRISNLWDAPLKPGVPCHIDSSIGGQKGLRGVEVGHSNGTNQYKS